MIYEYHITYILFLYICHNQCMETVILVAIIYVPIFLFDVVLSPFLVSSVDIIMISKSA